jgi:hypothetical protein
MAAPLPALTDDLTQDLELNVLLNAMAHGDRFVFDVARRQLLTGTDSLDEIRYRQDVLRDCLTHRAVVRELYQVTVEAELGKRSGWMGIYSRYPTGILSGAVSRMQLFTGLLKKLRGIADEHGDAFESEGFREFFALIQQELDDAYFRTIENRLTELTFRGGILLSASLGRGNEGSDHVLRRREDSGRTWAQDLLSRKGPGFSFSIHPRDDSGARALGELRDNGVNLVANAVAQSSDHIDGYLKVLRTELAFYIACVNLHEVLESFGSPVCFPAPARAEARQFSVEGLYDVTLALTMGRRITGNDIEGAFKSAFVITGANQGGKTVFLRSVGVAQLMMQCGMFVPAVQFRANLCRGLFTHFRREEDATMKSGKLDEELGRMSALVDHLRPHAMVLFNESFAATNEREGSEIAAQIVETLLDKRIKVFFVTHLYPLAHALWHRQRASVHSLRAERNEDGERTFRLHEGEPLETSFGKDIYEAVFHGAGDAQAVEPPHPPS